MVIRFFGAGLAASLREFLRALVWTAMLGCGASLAAPSPEGVALELKDVQQDIKAARTQLAEVDAERDAELARLRALENQQAEAGRAVYAARFAVNQKEGVLEDLRARHAALDEEIAEGLAQLDDNLRALYLLGAGHVLEGVLSPGDRADKMRVEGYLAQLRASRVAALQQLRSAREDNLRVQKEMELALLELARLQQEAENEQAALDRLRAEHEQAVDKLDAQHSAGEAKVRQLTRDQQSLERTLRKLEQAERAEAEAQAQAEAEAEKKQREEEAAAERRQEAQEKQQRAQKAEAEKARESAVKRAANASSDQSSPDEPAEDAPQDALAEKKPQARAPEDAGEIPVRGRKVRGFNEPTGVGELRSRGVFFAAQEGARVRVLADGKVVFADWVRGYGNLLIVQHKGGYLSLYAQNEAVLKSVGARVRRGEVVATAGRSGGERQTGVYVEVRRGGQPINPVRWSAWPKK